MAPKSFSEDGAIGGFGGDGTSTVGTGGSPLPSSAGQSGPMSAAGSPLASNRGDAGMFSGMADPSEFSANDWAVMNGDKASTPPPGSGRPQTAEEANNAQIAMTNQIAGGGQQSGNTATATGFSFADGGSVPDEDGDGDGDTSQPSGNGAIDTGDTDGSPQQDLMAKALQSVDATLQYSYQKYGLGGGQQEAGGQQQAAAMPMIPGSQSETPGPYQPGTPSQPPPQQMASNMPAVPGSQSNSGVPPQQPMPGPLPPTSNPFGKRADDQSGAIDTDEDAA